MNSSSSTSYHRTNAEASGSSHFRTASPTSEADDDDDDDDEYHHPSPTSSPDMPPPTRHNVIHLPNAGPNESAEPDIEPVHDRSYDDADPDPDPESYAYPDDASGSLGHITDGAHHSGGGAASTHRFHRDSESPSIDGSVVIKHNKPGRPDLDGGNGEDGPGRDGERAFEKRCWRRIGLSRAGWKGEEEIRSTRRGMGDLGFDEVTGKWKLNGRAAETDLNPQNFSHLLNHHLTSTSFLHLPTTPLFYPSTQVRSSASAALVHRLHHQSGLGARAGGADDVGGFGIRVLPTGLDTLEASLERDRAMRVGGNAHERAGSTSTPFLSPVSAGRERARVQLGMVTGHALEGSFAELNVIEDGAFGFPSPSTMGTDGFEMGPGGGSGGFGVPGRMSIHDPGAGMMDLGMDNGMMIPRTTPGLGPGRSRQGRQSGVGFGIEGFALGLDGDAEME